MMKAGDTPLAFEWQHQEPSAAHQYLLPAVLKALRRGDAARILDLGCGNGVFTARIAEHGFTMVGLDASPSGIAIARRLLPDVEFLEWPLEDPLPASLHQQFDAVISVEVIEHLPIPSVLCARAVEALRPGGRFVLTTPYHGYLKNLALAVAGQFDQHWQPTRDGGHIKFFSPRTLTALLDREGFAVLNLQRVGRIPPFAKSMVLECRQR